MIVVSGSRRPRIVVLQVPRFDLERPAGGAEVVAVQVATCLARRADVTVLHGWPMGQAASEREPVLLGPSLSAIPAFPIDDLVRGSGVLQPELTRSVRTVLKQADLAVSIERVLAVDIGAARLACLGGSGYAHAYEVLRSGLWDRLVVPSDSVLRELDPDPSETERIHVVPNGIDTSRFRPWPKRDGREGCRPIRLLVPSRPGWEKGHGRALALAGALQDRGFEVELTCLSQRGFLDADDFLGELAIRAAGLRLRVLPWREHRRMPELYADADLTLCLSEIPEGFGLAAAESVASGTPIVAADSGFLGRMLPAAHGIRLVEAGASHSMLADVALEALAVGRLECLHSGRPYIAERYDLERMRRAYAKLVDTLLDRWHQAQVDVRVYHHEPIQA